MAWKDYLSHLHLFRQDVVADPNLIVFKKYLLCVQQGWLRINGLAPNENCLLEKYLFDNEHVLLDFTHLSEESRKSFNEWFLSPAKDQHITHLSPIRTNDYRGYTAEVELSWWGRLMNLLFYRKKAYYWPLPATSTSGHQLQGISVCPGENGLFISIKQNKVEPSLDKYSDPQSNQVAPLLNVKRVFLNNELVKQLQKMDLAKPNYDEIIASPHPFSIPVNDKNKRFGEMLDYRIAEKLEKKQHWYKRTFNFIVNIFLKNNENKAAQVTAYDPCQFEEIIKTENAIVLQHPESGEVRVEEKRPELDGMVFCGGGAKIFGHIGALHAFDEAGIHPQKYAGSSAGAIMALFAYLGYSANDIKKLLKQFRIGNLIYYQSYQGGISNIAALKAGLDHIINNKIEEIIKKYVKDTPEDKLFLATKVYHQNKITFGSFLALKKRYPDCCLGEEIVVTVTNKKSSKTRYLSCTKTPNFELSQAVATSASFPVIFKPTLLEGEPHNDGGILCNFPTEAFHEDDSTLLFSEKGIYMRLVAFQFDNDGTERTILEKAVDRVYRENFILNWFYGIITGVKDPVSGWVGDRMKLLLHSGQTVLIKVGNVSSIRFNLNAEMREQLFNNGYNAAKEYIKARYKTAPNTGEVIIDPNTQQAINKECLYTRFASLDELLYFSCFKRNYKWFNLLADKMNEQGVDIVNLEAQRAQYFPRESLAKELARASSNQLTFFNHNYEEAFVGMKKLKANMQIFDMIYPVFLKFAPEVLIKNKKDLELYKMARHNLDLHNPFACLTFLHDIQGEVHIVFALLKNIMFTLGSSENQDERDKINCLARFIDESEESLFADPAFFEKWSLEPKNTEQLMTAIKGGDWNNVKTICSDLKNKPVPPIPLPAPKFKILKNPIELLDDDEELIDASAEVVASHMSLTTS